MAITPSSIHGDEAMGAAMSRAEVGPRSLAATAHPPCEGGGVEGWAALCGANLPSSTEVLLMPSVASVAATPVPSSLASLPRRHLRQSWNCTSRSTLEPVPAALPSPLDLHLEFWR